MSNEITYTDVPRGVRSGDVAVEITDETGMVTGYRTEHVTETLAPIAINAEHVNLQPVASSAVVTHSNEPATTPEPKSLGDDEGIHGADIGVAKHPAVHQPGEFVKPELKDGASVGTTRTDN